MVGLSAERSKRRAETPKVLLQIPGNISDGGLSSLNIQVHVRETGNEKVEHTLIEETLSINVPECTCRVSDFRASDKNTDR